jgi:hypothetical protein
MVLFCATVLYGVVDSSRIIYLETCFLSKLDSSRNDLSRKDSSRKDLTRLDLSRKQT